MSRSRRAGGPLSNAAEALNAEPPRIKVYRFEDAVALSVDGGVVYLSRRQAIDVSRALNACAVDVAKNADASQTKFVGFTLGDRIKTS